MSEGCWGLGQVSEDIESVASIRARAQQRLGKHQRMMEVLTAALGKPRTVYLTLSIVVAWVALNGVAPKLFGWHSIDLPPFFWLQGMIALSALLMTTLVLITANRQTRNARTPSRSAHGAQSRRSRSRCHARGRRSARDARCVGARIGNRAAEGPRGGQRLKYGALGQRRVHRPW